MRWEERAMRWEVLMMGHKPTMCSSKKKNKRRDKRVLADIDDVCCPGREVEPALILQQVVQTPAGVNTQDYKRQQHKRMQLRLDSQLPCQLPHRERALLYVLVIMN